MPRTARRHLRKRIVGAERQQFAAACRQLYEEEGVSIRDLAVRFDRSYGVVRALLLEAGTRLRDRGHAAPDAATVMTMAELYHQGWTLAAIGTTYDHAATTIRSWLVAAGVRIRPPGGTRPHASP